jgi:hypothetical protein
MGKRKKNAQNVVKVDLGDCTFGGSNALPVLVQHTSKDGRRIEKTVHKILARQSDPPLPTFEPRPVVTEVEDDMFIDVGSSSGEHGGDCVRSCFSFFSVFLIGVPVAVGSTPGMAH